MPLWLQNLTVILIALIAIAVVSRQLYAAVLGRRSKLGSCCSQGCASQSPAKKPPTAFIPSDLLTRRK